MGRGFLIIISFLLSSALLSALALLGAPSEKLQADSVKIVKTLWAYDREGVPTAIIDIQVLGRITLKGVSTSCGGPLKVVPGRVIGYKGEKPNELDPADPFYPGRVFVSADAVVSTGWLIRENVGVGRAELHEVYTGDGKLKWSGNDITLYKGKYVIAIKLRGVKLDVFNSCKGRLILGDSEKAFSVVLR